MEIAARVDVTTRTLQRWRLETDLVDPQQRITDGALDELISTHIEGQPRIGFKVLILHDNKSGTVCIGLTLKEY
jgi:hypothetical protein